MKRFGTRSATGKMVKLKLPVDVESLLIEASNRSGRSRSFEAVIRLKDHLHRYPKFNRAGNIYGKSLVKYLTMRLDDETNQLLQPKIVVDGVKQMRLQTELLII